MSKIQLNNCTIHAAVEMWFGSENQKNKCIEMYGHISDWDVSEVTNMWRLFDAQYKNDKFFNEDISKWNVQNVERIDGMFSCCNAFNQDLSNWQLNSVRIDYDMAKKLRSRITIEEARNDIIMQFGFSKSMNPNNYPILSDICVQNAITRTIYIIDWCNFICKCDEM